VEKSKKGTKIYRKFARFQRCPGVTNRFSISFDNRLQTFEAMVPGRFDCHRVFVHLSLSR
jgi:hypothetical protein